MSENDLVQLATSITFGLYVLMNLIDLGAACLCWYYRSIARAGLTLAAVGFVGMGLTGLGQMGVTRFHHAVGEIGPVMAINLVASGLHLLFLLLMVAGLAVTLATVRRQIDKNWDQWRRPAD